MTHQALPRVATPAEFLAATPSERRRLVRRQIDLLPEAWNQMVWIQVDPESYAEQVNLPREERDVCGTAFCFAGWTVLLAGDRFANDDYVADVDLTRISERAVELLGLPTRICDCGCGSVTADHALFIGANSLEEIDEILDDLDAREAKEQEA